MDRLRYFFADYWFSLFLLVAALGVGAILYRRRQRTGELSFLLVAVGAALALPGLGGLLFPLLSRLDIADNPATWAWWLAGLAGAGLFGMALVLILSGRWSAV